MMMEATMEKLELAFERGTHVNRQDYAVVSKLESLSCVAIRPSNHAPFKEHGKRLLRVQRDQASARIVSRIRESK